MHTLGAEASLAETLQCLFNVAVLRYSYGINLDQKSGTFQDNWTTTRVKNMIEAMHSIARKVGSVAETRQAFGNTTMFAGVAGLTGCASTEPGTSSNNIDWGNCSIDDPYSVFNIIHELGHVLQLRNDAYPSVRTDSTIAATGNYNRPRETWERMLILKQGQASYGSGLFSDIQAGFATTGRQNIGQGGRNHDEEVADMFLFWVIPSLIFDTTTDAGQLRQSFVNGFSTDDFEESGLALTSIGMSGWINRASKLSGNNASISTSTARISTLISNNQCLDLPFMNIQFIV